MGTGSNFAAFAKLRACTLLPRVNSYCLKATTRRRQAFERANGDWLEFRCFCETSCLYPFAPGQFILLKSDDAPPASIQARKRGLARISLLLRNFVPVPFCPGSIHTA